MQQGNVGAFITKRPKSPMCGAAKRRVLADRGDYELRAALQQGGNACITYPDGKLFERIHPNRPSISLNAWCEGVVALANDARLRAPDWHRFQARVHGWFTSLFDMPAIEFASEWRQDTVTDSVADVLKQQMREAIESGNIALMNECQVAIRTNLWHGERMIAAIEESKQRVLAQRSSPSIAQ